MQIKKNSICKMLAGKIKMPSAVKLEKRFPNKGAVVDAILGTISYLNKGMNPSKAFKEACEDENLRGITKDIKLVKNYLNENFKLEL